MKNKFYTRITLIFAITMIFTMMASSQTTLSIPIIDGNDDAEEENSTFYGQLGAMDRSSSDLELAYDYVPQIVGLIFRDVQIPVGATVTSAYVQFTVDAVDADNNVAIDLTVYGDKSSSAADIESTPFNISSRSSTDAVVNWSPTVSGSVGDAGVAEQTADISSVLNEIIGLSGWASGNNVMIIIEGDDTQDTDGNREMESYDSGSDVAPVLNITFTVAVASTPAITSLNPSSGEVGATVTITGTDFSTTAADNAVSFAGTDATVSASTATSITTTVPDGATTGDVTVTVGGETSDGVLFTVTSADEINISIPIISSADDAEEENSDFYGQLGTIDLGSSDLELAYDYVPQIVGLLFRDVQIPVGATVTSAYVQFTVDAVVTDNNVAIDLTVYGDKSSSGADIESTLFNISSRSSTDAVVDWSPAPSVAVDDAGAAEQTSDISSVLNEIIGLSGWASGNNVMIIIEGDDTQDTNGNREMESFDGTAAPVLNITFTAAVAPIPAITTLDPSSGEVGATVTITGTDFSTTAADNAVSFAGTDATVSASTATSITTTVPDGATTGDVTVTVGGEISNGVLFTVTIPEDNTMVSDISGGQSSIVYPNPTLETLNIKNPSTGEFGYEIYSITGKLVAKKYNIRNAIAIVDMSNLEKGLYLVNVRSAEVSITHKVILK